MQSQNWCSGHVEPGKGVRSGDADKRRWRNLSGAPDPPAPAQLRPRVWAGLVAGAGWSTPGAIPAILGLVLLTLWLQPGSGIYCSIANIRFSNANSTKCSYCQCKFRTASAKLRLTKHVYALQNRRFLEIFANRNLRTLTLNQM